MFSVAVGRMHCACRDERGRGEERVCVCVWGGVGRRKQERGSVRCSEVGSELKSEESAVTRLLDGQLDMFFVIMYLC